jgi:hypothetical protein
MATYGLNVLSATTGATANTFITLLGLKMANTVGHRCRLRSLIVGGAGGASQDLMVSLKIGVTDNTGDGTSTAVNVNTIGKHDANAIASNVNAIGKNYSAEPTTVGTGLMGGISVNTRGTVVKEWGPLEAIKWGPNQSLVILGAPGASTAATLDISLEWEEGF